MIVCFTINDSWSAGLLPACGPDARILFLGRYRLTYELITYIPQQREGEFWNYGFY
jgi:hypothetical protein